MPASLFKGPVLPTEEDVGRLPNLEPPNEEAEVRVPDYTRIGNIGRGLEGLGQGISEVGTAAEDVQKQNDALDVTRADSFLKQHIVGMKQAFSQDPDYSTFGQRFDEQASAANEAAAQTISNPNLRAKFQADAGILTADARAQVMNRGFELGQQTKVAALQGALEQDKNLYANPANSDEDRAKIRADIDAKINLNVQTGLISPAQGYQYGQTYIKGAVEQDANTQLQSDPLGLKVDTSGVGPFSRLAQSESGGRYSVINSSGYGGKYQVGAPRLFDLGDYTPGPNEDVHNKNAPGGWSGQKWSGTFNIPGHPEVKTINDFLNGPTAKQAQDDVFQAHVAKMDEEIKSNGLDKYEGQTVAGVPITKEGLYNMLHLGGVGSTSRFLQSGGQDNPKDANGTSILNYAAMGARSSRFALLDPDDKALLLNKADAKLKLDNSAIRGLVADDVASIRSTGQGLNIDPQKISESLTSAELNKYVEDRADAKTFYDNTNDMKSLPPEQIQQRLDRLAPQPGAPGFARQQKILGDVTLYANAVNKDRAQDPAASVRSIPEVAQAYAAAAQDPKALPGAIAASLRAQSAVDIPDNMQRVLSNGEAQDEVGKLTAPQSDPKASLDAVQAKYGAMWPKAFRDMVTMGKMPEGYQAISALDDPNDGKMLARWLGEVPPGKGANDLLGPGVTKAVGAVVDGSPAVQDYAYALSRSGAPGGQVAAVKNAINQLAYANVAFNKMAPADAADKAIAAFTGKYSFDMPGNPRVPAAVADTVSGNASMVLDAIDENNITIPPGHEGKNGLPTASDYVRLLKANPVWITSPQSDAIWLKDDQDYIVRHTNGNPVSIPFSSPPLPSRTISPTTMLLTQPPAQPAAQPATPPQPAPAGPTVTAGGIRG